MRVPIKPESAISRNARFAGERTLKKINSGASLGDCMEIMKEHRSMVGDAEDIGKIKYGVLNWKRNS